MITNTENKDTIFLDAMHILEKTMQMVNEMMLRQYQLEVNSRLSDEKLLLSIDEAAKMLGNMAPNDVRNMCKDGLLTAVNVKMSERKRVTLGSIKRYVEGLEKATDGAYHTNEYNVMKNVLTTRTEAEKFIKK